MPLRAGAVRSPLPLFHKRFKEHEDVPRPFFKAGYSGLDPDLAQDPGVGVVS